MPRTYPPSLTRLTTYRTERGPDSAAFDLSNGLRTDQEYIGGRVELRRLEGRLVVDISRCTPGVEVRVDAPAVVTSGAKLGFGLLSAIGSGGEGHVCSLCGGAPRFWVTPPDAEAEIAFSCQPHLGAIFGNLALTGTPKGQPR